MTAPRARVVVIGCGFGGLAAVRKLSPARIDITLVDRTNHHLFQPLLYQVATAGLSAPAVSAPIRHILRHEMRRGNLTVLQGEAVDVDAAAREVVLAAEPDAPHAIGRLGYDHLVVAAGATNSYFGHADWAAHAPGLKTLADALSIRARVIGAFEEAERSTHDAARAQWLTFVIIGGGPTGAEMAGTLTEIARHTLRGEFRQCDPSLARVVLLEGADRILGTFDASLSQRARASLERLGVDVRTGCRVTAIDPNGLRYEQGGNVVRLDARTVIWAAGVAGVPFGRALAQATGARIDRTGRLPVEPDLTLHGHAEISVIGDLAAALSYGPGEPKPAPGVSPSAKQMGRCAAANVLSRIEGRPTKPFRYIDYGALATVGRKAAIVELSVPGLGALRFSGLPAWLFWLFAHIYFLIGFRNRLMVMTDWAWAYVTYQRSARVVAVPERPPVTPALPGPNPAP
jgi:NADH dehydrogenase